ncbi:MAG UNVERIFIED_CONTAM: hypothetical protein LVT10_18110 [Anaerolineae bacterium]
MFTHAGFAKLALPEEAMWSFAREFIYGMVKRSPILGDEGFNEPTELGRWRSKQSRDSRAGDIGCQQR